MKTTYKIILLFCCLSAQLFAQEKPAASSSSFEKKSIIKLNLTSLAFTNVYFQYELAFTPKSSACLGISFLPERGLPSAAVKDDPSNNAANLTFSGWAITPEYRYHFSGKSPRGFYVAPYFRHSSYSTSGYSFTYDKSNNAGQGTVVVDGDLSATTVGLMFGAQWLIGEHFSIDWWIIGAGFGSSEVKLTGTGTFSAQDQSDIRDEFESIDVPFGTMKADVDGSKVNVSYKTGMPGGRGFGLAIGYVF